MMPTMMTMNRDVKVIWAKAKKLKAKEILTLLAQSGLTQRDDLGIVNTFATYIETSDGRLFYYWREYDETTGTYPDRKMKGIIFDDINEYAIIHADLTKLSQQKGYYNISTHKYYFKNWDDTGETYIRDLLMILPVKPLLLDFSKSSLIAIDQVIKQKKLPEDVLDESLFLPAVAGYIGVHLERFHNRTIHIYYSSSENSYSPYYVSGNQKNYLYPPIYEEAMENPSRFSLDVLVDGIFF
jgi:hypothetical protein